MRAEILWQDGPFSCEYRRGTTPPQLCLSKFEEAVLLIAIASAPEAYERACGLRLMVMNNLASNQWVEA